MLERFRFGEFLLGGTWIGRLSDDLTDFELIALLRLLVITKKNPNVNSQKLMDYCSDDVGGGMGRF